MRPYLNKSGRSGVSQYEITDDSIIIIFLNSRTRYLYSNSLTSEYHVSSMKKYAVAGIGLSTYITKHRDVLKFTR